MNKQQLWNSILQQAIFGKLVPQLDSEPAVEQIGPALDPDDVPFELPEKWTLVQLSSITTLINGRAYKKAELLEEAPGLTPIIRVGNFFTQSKIYYSDLELAPKHYCNKGDLLFAWSASFGPKIWEGPRSIFHYHIWKIEYNPQYLDCKWLYYWLEERSEALKSSGHGIAMIHITKQEMEKKPIAVPPLEEQRRIVAKLEELKPLVDQFGEAYDKLSELEADFPRKLKASILQAAMQGKLVPQLDCEPAVEQIGLAPADDEVPFTLPEKWKWVQFDKVLELISGRDLAITQILDKPTQSSVPYITGASQMIEGCLVLNRWTEVPVVISHKNDVLLSCKGTVGKLALNTCGDIHIARQIMAIRCKAQVSQCEHVFVKLFFEFVTNKLQSQVRGLIPGISRKDVLSLWFPLPPLEEQRRIVARIEELFAEVDKMSSCKAP